MKSKTPKTKPLFVAISDVHYSLSTLELADKAFRAAIDKADELGVPLIDLGDITNDKAIIRGEVMNCLIDTMKYARRKGVEVFCIIGNHSLLNEKGKEHGLQFLAPYVHIIDYTTHLPELGVYCIPYQNNWEHFVDAVSYAPKGALILAHQGFNGAAMGDYIVDKTSLDPGVVKDYKVISGHYHRHQTIGTVTYVGNPYTLSFGESTDGPKGFLVVNDDGTHTQIELDYRRHIIANLDSAAIVGALSDGRPLIPDLMADDLLWVKLKGPSLFLDQVKKSDLGRNIGHMNFKLDKIPTDEVRLDKTKECRTDEQVMDALIDSGGDTADQKLQLKNLWRELL